MKSILAVGMISVVALAPLEVSAQEAGKAAGQRQFEESWDILRDKVRVAVDQTAVRRRPSGRRAGGMKGWKIVAGLAYVGGHFTPAAPIFYAADLLLIAAACGSDGIVGPKPAPVPPPNPCPQGEDPLVQACSPFKMRGASGSAGAEGDRYSSYDKDGRRGYSGSKGPKITVVFGRVQNDQGKLGIQAVINGQSFFWETLEGKKIFLSTEGGDGGKGGRGADVSRGYCPGSGGDGGNAGNGGDVEVFLTDPTLTQHLAINNRSGVGGEGGSAGCVRDGGWGSCSHDQTTDRPWSCEPKNGKSGSSGSSGAVIYKTIVASPFVGN